MKGKDIAARARALVGTRFRPQGRSSEGLDCVGLVVLACAIDPAQVRRDYDLRGAHLADLRTGMTHLFRGVAKSRQRVGDVLMMLAGRDQVHLAVRTEAGFVHAHAGLRRVVETPGDPPWPIIQCFRRRARSKRTNGTR